MTSLFETEVVQQDPPSRSGRLALFVLLVIVLIATGVGWWLWTRSPQYALSQVASAYKEHDLAKFDEYVDRERLAGSFVDQIMQQALKSEESKPDDWANGLAQGMAMMMRTQLVKALNDSLAQGGRIR